MRRSCVVVLLCQKRGGPHKGETLDESPGLHLHVRTCDEGAGDNFDGPVQALVGSG
jgi:hypothetical protein